MRLALADDDDLDARIVFYTQQLAELQRRRRDRDHAALLLAILERSDQWFTASELRAFAPRSPTLAAIVSGASAKSLGRRLKRIADAQDRSGTVPTLRLLRHKTSTAATVWKVETYRPACGAPGVVR